MNIYKKQVIDNWKNPRNWGKIKDATSSAEIDNPLCGDRITLSIKAKGDTIIDIKFRSEGCAISTASASLLTEEVKKLKSFAKIKKIDEKYLLKLLGVPLNPSRTKCANLSLTALKKVLEND